MIPDKSANLASFTPGGPSAQRGRGHPAMSRYHNQTAWQSSRPALIRDVNLRYIRQHGGAKWKREHDYHRRSLAETAMFLMKTVFGQQLSVRRLGTQATQVGIRCRALNRMTHLGLPIAIA